MTTLLKPLIKKQEGKEIFLTPQIIIEVAYEEIQNSSEYGSGYALRFPRLVRIRLDRSPHETSTLRQVEGFYKEQY